MAGANADEAPHYQLRFRNRDRSQTDTSYPTLYFAFHLSCFFLSSRAFSTLQAISAWDSRISLSKTSSILATRTSCASRTESVADFVIASYQGKKKKLQQISKKYYQKLRPSGISVPFYNFTNFNEMIMKLLFMQIDSCL